MADTDTFKKRVEIILSAVFCGWHHVDQSRLHFSNENSPYEMCEYSTYQELSTFDFERLTTLVIAAHEECVRITVTHSGPKRVKIQMWPRVRDGRKSERHPTIEQAIEEYRRWSHG